MYIIGNWKMAGDSAFAARHIACTASLIRQLRMPSSIEIVHCPPFLWLQQSLALAQASPLAIGAQDCSLDESGAHTGDISATMLAGLGCNYVIIGHSERRIGHRESHTLVAGKLRAAIAAGLSPILCLGETKAQREDGDYQAVIMGQLDSALAAIQWEQSKAELLIGYEPVWAIGSGETPSEAEITEVTALIHARLADYPSIHASLLYGGSVNAANAAAILNMPYIGGLLVGGASLDLQEWTDILKAAKSQSLS